VIRGNKQRSLRKKALVVRSRERLGKVLIKEVVELAAKQERNLDSLHLKRTTNNNQRTLQKKRKAEKMRISRLYTKGFRNLKPISQMSRSFTETQTNLSASSAKRN